MTLTIVGALGAPSVSIIASHVSGAGIKNHEKHPHVGAASKEDLKALEKLLVQRLDIIEKKIDKIDR